MQLRSIKFALLAAAGLVAGGPVGLAAAEMGPDQLIMLAGFADDDGAEVQDASLRRDAHKGARKEDRAAQQVFNGDEDAGDEDGAAADGEKAADRDASDFAPWAAAGSAAPLLRAAMAADGAFYLTRARLSALGDFGAAGGFGDSIFSRDDGVADMLAIAAPNTFSALSFSEFSPGGRAFGLSGGAIGRQGGGGLLGSAALDPLQAPLGRTNMTTLFPGAKVGLTYRADTGDCVEGVCLTPQTVLLGLQQDGAAALAAPVQWDDIMEVALFYERAFGNGFAVGVSGAYVTADEQSNAMPEVFDSYQAYAVGANLAFGGFSVGGAYRTSNGGYAAQEDNYVAFDAGIAYEAGPWGFMVGYENSDAGHDAADPLNRALFRQTQAYQTGVTYMLGAGISIGVAGQFVQSDKHEFIGGDKEAAAIVFESSIKF